MAYSKQTWDTTSYVNPTRMNHIEDGIENALTFGANSYLGAKNLNSTPYYHESQTLNGITWTINADGTVKANGTATAQSTLLLHSRSNTTNALVLPNGDYILSGCPSGGSTSKYYINLGRTINGAFQGLGNDVGSGKTFTLDGDDFSDTEVRLNFGIVITNGQTVNNLTFKPMIRLAGDNDNTYYPYAMTNRELTMSLPQKIAFTGTLSASGNIDLKSYFDSSKYFIVSASARLTSNTSKLVVCIPYQYSTNDFGRINGLHCVGETSSIVVSNEEIEGYIWVMRYVE